MKTHAIIKDWITAAGLRSICIVNDSGYINGYVEVNKSSILAGSPYYFYTDDIVNSNFEEIKLFKQDINNIYVHGGITFAEYGDKNWLPTDNYWFGFDTSHSGDLPNLNYVFNYLKESDNEILSKTINIALSNIYNSDYTFKDLEYVSQECESLAEQLRSIQIKYEC